MLKTRTMYLMTALLLGLAAIEPSSADSQEKLSLPSSASAHDYWSASKASFQLASKHSRLNETRAACEELAKSLGYYRVALAKETESTREIAFVDGDDSEGM